MLLSELGHREVRASYSGSMLRSVCSKYGIEKLALRNTLVGHHGCVNSVLFSWDGSMIYTGSDDLHVNIYETYLVEAEGEDSTYSNDSTEQSPKWRVRTMHTNNIFFVKDMPHSNKGKIATCAADGKVIMMNFDEGRTDSTVLLRHRGRAHRLALHTCLPNCLYTCGEDGYLNFIDIREDNDILQDEASYINFDSLYEKSYITEKQYDSYVLYILYHGWVVHARGGTLIPT